MRKQEVIIYCMVAAGISGCVSLNQKPSEVYLRQDGHRLKPWKSAADASAIHLPFAWASVSAYLHDVDGKDIDVTACCPDPHEVMRFMGWELWEELPRVGRKSDPKKLTKLETELKAAHLRVEVWSNKAENTVIVAFGGTAGIKDITANARWVLPFLKLDAYEVLTDSYVPAFTEAYQDRATKEDGGWLRHAKVISTGHSLGGGLAQRFAYSLAPEPDVPGVKEIYAFNSSPVIGKREVKNFAERAKGMKIYRVYNRGEVLATVRSTLQWINLNRGPSQGQTWIDIRYSSDWSWRTRLPVGALKAHAMHGLACFMKDSLPSNDPKAVQIDGSDD